VGTDEESGDTLSVARVDLKTFRVPDLSATRLAYGFACVAASSGWRGVGRRRLSRDALDEVDDSAQ
jgi:hypothetical protein